MAMSSVPKINGEVEALHGIQVDMDSITIDVVSSGCTTQDSFKFAVRKSGDGRSTMVTVIRVLPDYCEAVSHHVSLIFQRKEIGLDTVQSFTLTNPLRGFPRI